MQHTSYTFYGGEQSVPPKIEKAVQSEINSVGNVEPDVRSGHGSQNKPDHRFKHADGSPGVYSKGAGRSDLGSASD